MRTDGNRLVPVTSVIDHYNVTTFDVAVLYEMIVETFYDGTASGAFVDKAMPLMRAYVEFV